MASEEDIWIESDGKRIIFATKTITGATVTIPELSIVHRALVQPRNSSYNITIASGGISGNAIKLEAWDNASGTWATISDLTTISGTLIDVVAAGA